jgi:hypothetical protein
MNGRQSGVRSGLDQGGCGEAVRIGDEPVVTLALNTYLAEQIRQRLVAVKLP